jgi:acyl-[acyl-carrier-protein] desaturase
LERGRMYQVQQGYQKPDTTALGGLAYVSLQELATRISHRNTGHYTNDPVADRLLARVAADENLHMIFYRDAVEAALEVDPSRTVAVICQEVQRFQMPGAGIVDFASKSVQIAKAEIYDLRIHHDEVLQPLLRHWKLFELSGLDEKAEKAREQLTAFMSGLDSLATHYRERTAAARERDRAREAAPAAGR